jgi:hypothetical protein
MVRTGVYDDPDYLPKNGLPLLRRWQTKTGGFGEILEKDRIGASETAKMYLYLRFEWQIPDNNRPLRMAL